MEQVFEFGDARSKGFCVHCGGPDETDDHAPSKIFLDTPYPENLPVAPACDECNQGFSPDEEYLAALIECVLAGHANPDLIERTRIARKLRDQPGLRARLKQARRVEAEGVVWDTEPERVRRVVLKLARAHVAFELNEPQLAEPLHLTCRPLGDMDETERRRFEIEGTEAPAIFPEVGSRAMRRLLVMDGVLQSQGWLEVQPGRYRYLVGHEGGTWVKLVIRDYLAAEVRWP